MGLIDLGGVTGRKYGGAGFSVDGLPVEVHAEPASHNVIVGLENCDGQYRQDCAAALDRVSHHVAGQRQLRITVQNVPPQHVGLGSKTAVVLAILKASEISLGGALNRARIQELSFRGGTSGIGINTFFCGGFIADGGLDAGASPGFSPSSVHRELRVPPIVVRTVIPRNWVFHLLLSHDRRLSGAQEVEFFRMNTPLPRIEVLKTLAIVYHGIVPAFLLGDLALLRKSLAELCSTGFKRRELLGQSDNVRAAVEMAGKTATWAVGLSSMGPLIYVVTPTRDLDANRRLGEICTMNRLDLLGSFHGRNNGFEAES